MINSGRALSAEGLKYLTRSPGNYASSLRWTLWCSNSIFLSHTDESSKDETRVCGCSSVGGTKSRAFLEELHLREERNNWISGPTQ